MSSSNYSVGLQRLKPVHTVLHNLAKNWSWAQDINGRDETETRRGYVSRLRRWDQDHKPALELATAWTTLAVSDSGSGRSAKLLRGLVAWFEIEA